MQAYYEPEFEREQGITEAEWLQMLPRAVGTHALQLSAPGQARVEIGGGGLHLDWAVLPPRRIALISMPRLRVHYRFAGLPDAERQAFMKRFDLHIQRGGG